MWHMFFFFISFFSYNTNEYINSAKPMNGHDRGEPQVFHFSFLLFVFYANEYLSSCGYDRGKGLRHVVS